MIVIVDYGVGNLFSLASSFDAIGYPVRVSGDADVIRAADKIILPGVGAFGDAAKKLRDAGLDRVLCEEADAGKPLLGICLGMQLLFEVSYEYGEHRGLGLIPGSVVPIGGVIPPELKIPHIGWNGLVFPEGRPKSVLYGEVGNGEHVYFVHSFYAKTEDEFVSARTEYGALLTASVERGNVFGTQFHPEKSGDTGLAILRAFARL